MRWLPPSVALVGVLAAPAASAFSTQGNHWPNQAGQPVDYRIAPDGAPGIEDGSDLEAVRRAFATWQSVACSLLSFREQPWMDPKVVQADNLNRIFWVSGQTEWPTEQRTTIALTYAFYRTTDRVITDADIIANAVYYQWTTTDGMASQTTVDLETVIFHEIGHFFGLDHSSDPQAAMFPANNKPNQRAPAIDDINGICSLYPNGQPVPGTPQNGGATGAPCQKAEDCQSRLCIEDTVISRAYCTEPCSTAQTNMCPAGYQCTTTAEGEYCLAPPPVEELCDQCSGSTQCSSGLCLNVPGYNYYQPFCTRACDPTSGVPGQCPNNYGCVQVYSQGQTGGVCAPTSGVCDPAGKGGHGEPCYANGGCKPNHVCVDYFGSNSGYRYCYYQCTPALAGQSCSDAGDIICLNIAEVPNTAACLDIAQPGRPCVPEQCAPGSICAWDENIGIDTAICYQFCPDTGCPANTQCQTFEGIGSICVPNMGFKPLGASCASDEECELRTCRNYGDDRLCTTPCSVSNPQSCPNGFRCVAPTGLIDGLCWPIGFTDGNATDLDRRVNLSQIPQTYCACDTTSACDGSCECDPECQGGGCGCRAASRARASALWAFLAAALWLRRRERSA
ncbi:MAG: matrixin family metalloprotease [Deltaproteobacteria bacterium]|nr:matrixin family metalloprotease [Deltaproteobacteria bacterium]